MNSKFYLFLLSLFSAFLLATAWYFNLSILIFFAFVPLLKVEDVISKSVQFQNPKLILTAFTYLVFFIWNFVVTWWVCYASIGGAIAAFIFNSLLMTVVFLFFSSLKKTINKPWAIWLLIPIWIGWEHWHTIWDISWTWLTLGNVFAFTHNWVQWYEYTGTSGGTLWILAANIFLFNTLKTTNTSDSLKAFFKPFLKMVFIILIPIIASYSILFSKSKLSKSPIQTLIVQPNIDPYNSKFTLDFETQFSKVLTLIKSKIKQETDYLVLPETFITENLNEENINISNEIKLFRDSIISKFKKLKIITGGNSYVVYKNEKSISATARKDKSAKIYYDLYNSAFQIDSNSIQIYHKSKLVPGVERMPFPYLLRPLESLAIDMGGTMGSLGVQADRAVFIGNNKSISIAPVVCYESIYANYVTEYIRKGADLIFIITNDGWWKNTPGYIQHLNYARLRAIENRRQIARCANTGISCFIDEFGTISDATKWWEEAVIEKKIYKNDSLTFFSRFGDLISYFSVIISILLIVYSVFLRRFNFFK